MTGIVDDSGVELTLTTELREHDMTTIFTGAPTNSILRIPPKQKRFAVKVETTLKLASTVRAFSSALHAHQVGNYLEAWLIRDGDVVGNLGVEDPYDFNFQRFLPLPQEMELRPGDVVRLVCTYNTMSRDTCTHGGDGSQDEMCLHFMAVYPATGVAQAAVIESNFQVALSNPVDAWQAVHPDQPWMWPQWVSALAPSDESASGATPSPPPPSPPPSAALLDTSAAALAGATNTVTVGSSPNFWSAIPTSPNEYAAAVGDKLRFQYSASHNVWLMSSYAKWQACDFSGGTELASTSQGGGSGTTPNLFEAVTADDGTLYIACQQSGHCNAGQKVQIVVGAGSSGGSAGGGVMDGWTPAYQPVGAAEYNPCTGD